MAGALGEHDLSTLQDYASSGDRYGYWSYLADRGDRYAVLDLGVVTGETIAGFVADNFAASYAPSGSSLAKAWSMQAWWPVGVALMQADLQPRRDAIAGTGNTLDAGLDLSFQTIQTYHETVFRNFGLPAPRPTACSRRASARRRSRSWRATSTACSSA